MALRDWNAARSSNLDALLGAHQAVTGGLPGRLSLTTELNHALIARLASELQGFARDLHDQAGLWPNIHAAYPNRGTPWHEWLEWLNLARNGIAHNDPIKMLQAGAVHPLTLATFRTARGVLNQFVTGMDVVAGTYLRTRTGVSPW